MECTCSVDFGDGFTTMIEERWNRARKEHKCCECYDTINKNEKYFVEKEVYDGAFSTHKTCVGCKEVRDRYFSSGFYWEELWETLRECFDDIGIADFEAFSPAAQQKIQENLFDY